MSTGSAVCTWQSVWGHGHFRDKTDEDESGNNEGLYDQLRFVLRDNTCMWNVKSLVHVSGCEK